MFKYYTLYLLLILLIMSSSINAQWVKCNGFSNEDVRSIITLGNNIYAGILDKGVYVSTDNGNNWSQTSLNNKTVWSLLTIGNTIYAATGNGVFQSANNGAGWTQTSLNNKNVYALANIGNTIFAGTADSGVYLSTNNGTSWTQTTLNNKLILTLISLGNTLYASAAHEGIFMSSNNGTSWVKTSYPGDAWSFTNVDNYLFAGGFYGGVHLSTNSGTSWSQITLDGITVYSMTFFGNNVFAGTYQSGIYLSANKGSSWTEINQGLGKITVKALHVKDNYIYAGTENGVWRRLMSEITAVEKISSEIPSQFNLFQNYPNPFNPSTIIKYELKTQSHVKLSISNILGETVLRAVDNFQPAGFYQYEFNASNLSSGFYFCKLAVGNYSETKKMVLIR